MPGSSFSPTAYVLFLDMLGFSALVKAQPHKVVFTTLADDETRIAPHETDSWQRFFAFHSLLDNIDFLPRLSKQHRVLIFSDCAFVVADAIQEAGMIAIHLMRLFLNCKVPVRMAIAGGTFHAHRFSSDTTVDTTLTRAVFYGTAVVFAHETEKTGGKGCRIFLHKGLSPEALQGLREMARVIPLPAETDSAAYELSYIEDGNKGTEHDDDDRLIHGLSDLYSRLEKPVRPEIAVQYTDTLAAINRMRAASGKRLYDFTFEDEPSDPHSL